MMTTYGRVGQKWLLGTGEVVELPPKPKPSAEADSGDVPTVVVDGSSASPPLVKEGGGGRSVSAMSASAGVRSDLEHISAVLGRLLRQLSLA